MEVFCFLLWVTIHSGSGVFDYLKCGQSEDLWQGHRERGCPQSLDYGRSGPRRGERRGGGVDWGVERLPRLFPLVLARTLTPTLVQLIDLVQPLSLVLVLFLLSLPLCLKQPRHLHLYMALGPTRSPKGAGPVLLLVPFLCLLLSLHLPVLRAVVSNKGT